MEKKIIIGTRGSILAVAQAETVKNMLLEKFPDLEIELKKIVTSGDRDQSNNWGEESLKSLFVKEIEKELLEGSIDLAVHSMKDMPQISPEGLINACFPLREDNRDVLITKNNIELSSLPKNAVIGTSSLRRKAGMLNLRDDFEIKPIRGNIHTRLKKLENEEFDGIILAAAGLIRTGLQDKITQYLPQDKMMPAPAQGILCIQCKENNSRIIEILEKIDDKKTRIICEAEREFSKIFDGGCHTPMGCSAIIVGNEILLNGMYFNDGKLYFGEVKGDTANPKKAAHELADIIRRQMNEKR